MFQIDGFFLNVCNYDSCQLFNEKRKRRNCDEYIHYEE